MTCREVAQVRNGRAERRDLSHLTLREEPISDPALIQHLDRARVKTVLDARTVIPLHFEGWGHFTQGAGELKAAFSGNGIADRLVMLERGQRAEV